MATERRMTPLLEHAIAAYTVADAQICTFLSENAYVRDYHLGIGSLDDSHLCKQTALPDFDEPSYTNVTFSLSGIPNLEYVVQFDSLGAVVLERMHIYEANELENARVEKGRIVVSEDTESSQRTRVAEVSVNEKGREKPYQGTFILEGTNWVLAS